MLQALGAEFLDEGGKQVPFGARGVEKLASINCEHILFELKECDFRIACDVDNPLCGEKAAATSLVRKKVQLQGWQSRWISG